MSWFQDAPQPSLDLVAAAAASPAAGIVDVGGGASRLVDHLVARGFRDVTVVDLSEAALATARARLAAARPDGAGVAWVVADATTWRPARRFAVWHDRAAFHFLVEAADRAAYVARLAAALAPGGQAIIATFATFAPDGPAACSGLPVMRYDAAGLARALGPAFEPVHARRHLHVTPGGTTQAFQFGVFRRAG